MFSKFIFKALENGVKNLDVISRQSRKNPKLKLWIFKMWVVCFWCYLLGPF